MDLSDSEKRILLETSREAIAARLDHRRASYPAAADRIMQACGAFVTLRIDGELRGCIGRMTSPDSLFETVKEMAIASAFEDPRFDPLTRAELDRVNIEISALGPLESVRGIHEIIVGTHGVYVRSGAFSGVLLPQVAVEQRWDARTFLAHACRKAGLGCDAWEHAGTEISVFTAVVFAEASAHRT